MVSSKIFLLAIMVIGVQCRHVYIDRHPKLYYFEDSNTLEDDIEDILSEDHYYSGHPRVTRQVQGVMNTNPDGGVNLNAKIPLANNGQNALSAVVSGSGLKSGGTYGAAGAGLQLDNINGHQLSLTKTHIPSFGDQLTAAGKVNLLNTDLNNINANAFVTRNMPTIPNVPNFNTQGVGVDYTFNNKLGASFNAAQTPLFQKTDLSAMGNLNLFRDRTSSLDFNAGATRSFSPFIPKSSWQPAFGLTFSKGW